MKKRLSLYWRCQIIGWLAFILFVTLVYSSTSGLFIILKILPPLFLVSMLGMLITHIMRMFIIKARLLELTISSQIIYMLPATIFFSFIYSVIAVWLSKVLQLGEELFSLYRFEGKINKTIILTSSNSFLLSLWNLIYFSYHYIEKSKREQIEKIRFEKELQIQKLEGEKTKAELERQATEQQIKAMVATQEQERKRISRDLHDDVGTKLSALNLYLSSLNEKAAAINNNEIRSIAQGSKQFIKEMMYDIRQLLLDLSPTVLENFGYTAAVEGLVNKINETKQIHFDLVVLGMNNRLKKDYELGLYRITQELINNVLKHAEAKHVSLEIGQRDEKITLRMEDDGKGFDVDAHKDGYGLNNLDARTKLMQGTITIHSQLGKGTSVLVQIPYDI